MIIPILGILQYKNDKYVHPTKTQEARRLVEQVTCTYQSDLYILSWLNLRWNQVSAFPFLNEGHTIDYIGQAKKLEITNE